MFIVCGVFGCLVNGYFYFVVHLGDRLNLHMFLTLGMIGNTTFVALFGLGYWWNIYHFSYYLVIQMIEGLFQATGWSSLDALLKCINQFQ